MPLLMSLLLGCPVQPLETAEDTAPVCDISISETRPANGSEEAYYRAPVEFQLTEPDPTAIVVANFDGVQSSRGDGSVIVYTPTVPLEPETSYTAGLEYCHGTPEIEFTTSAMGQALDDPGALEGKLYSIDMFTARFLAGKEVAETAASLFDRRLLASVIAVDGDWLHLRIGKATADDVNSQDYCARTVDLPAANFSNTPWFHLNANEVDFNAYASELSLLQFQLSGTFSQDGSEIGGISMQTYIDARDMANLVTGQTADSLCEIVGNLYIACEPCPTDGHSYCFALTFDSLSATVSEGELESVAEPRSDPRCEDLPEE